MWYVGETGHVGQVDHVGAGWDQARGCRLAGAVLSSAQRNKCAQLWQLWQFLAVLHCTGVMRGGLCGILAQPADCGDLRQFVVVCVVRGVLWCGVSLL